MGQVINRRTHAKVHYHTEGKLITPECFKHRLWGGTMLHSPPLPVPPSRWQSFKTWMFGSRKPNTPTLVPTKPVGDNLPLLIDESEDRHL